MGNYYNTFSNKSSFYSAFPSNLSVIVFPSHQVGSLIHHIEYRSEILKSPRRRPFPQGQDSQLKNIKRLAMGPVGKGKQIQT